MTFSRTFTLPLGNTWYNLWALISAAFTNPFFNDGSNYVPSTVWTLEYQSQSASTNPNNGGSTLNISFDGLNQSGEDLTSGSGDKVTGVIDLHNVYFRHTNAGAGFNVTCTTSR